MEREITIEIPLLMTTDGNNFMIASKHLAIYIQGSTEDIAKDMFEQSADMLFTKWLEEDRMIDQLKAKGLIKKDVIISDDQPSHPSFIMPNLPVGHYENMQVAVC